MRDWDFVQQICDRAGAHFDGLKADTLAIEPRTRLIELGLNYQDYVYALARALDTGVAVETGVKSGVSTRYILEALAAQGGEGVLYSCDPMYRNDDAAKLGVSQGAGGVVGAAWSFEPKRSVDWLPSVAATNPEWDLFVHDSNLNLENRTYEMEFAWSMLGKNGLLVVAEWDWPAAGPKHLAVERFSERHGDGYDFLGRAAVFQKHDGPDEANVADIQRAAVEVAIAEVKNYGRGLTSAYDYYLTH